jgi:predicted phosphodiesterase
MSNRLLFSLRIGVCLLLACTENLLFSQSNFASIGDAGALTHESKMVRESIHSHGVKQLILPGDNLYNHVLYSYEKVWSPWTALGMQFAMVAIGNHNQDYKIETKFFDMPDEFYTKKIDGIRFIVLNSDNEKRIAEQAVFLEKVLEGTTSPYVFLIYHHPSYTVSSFHNWEEKKEFQLAIRPIIWKYRSKLTALLVGHDHLASLLHFNDLPVILSGAVQEVRRDTMVDHIDRTDPQNPVVIKSAWYFDHTPYWAKLSVPTEKDPKASFASVDFIRAKDNHVACSVKLITGKAAELEANCLTKPSLLP